MVFQPALIPYKFFIRVVNAWAIMKWSCRTILEKARSRRGVVFRGAPVDLPGTKVPVAACLRRMQLMVARVRPTRPAMTLCCTTSWESASTSCLIPIGVEWSFLEQSARIEKNAIVDLNLPRCEGRSGGNDHLSCSFELLWSHLALKWKSGKAKVGFHWVSVTGTFHVSFSPLEAHKFNPYLFYCNKLGCNNLFPRMYNASLGINELKAK